MLRVVPENGSPPTIMWKHPSKKHSLPDLTNSDDMKINPLPLLILTVGIRSKAPMRCSFSVISFNLASAGSSNSPLRRHPRAFLPSQNHGEEAGRLFCRQRRWHSRQETSRTEFEFY